MAEEKGESKEIRLLIVCGSQFSLLPVPIRKRRYKSKGWGREDREKRVEVSEYECNGVKTPSRLSDAAHLPHKHTLVFVCGSACECTPVINLNYTMECRPCAISSYYVKSHKQQQRVWEEEQETEMQQYATERVRKCLYRIERGKAKDGVPKEVNLCLEFSEVKLLWSLFQGFT